MTAIVQFEHRGVPCAIPASQAHAVDVRVPDSKLTSLWDGTEVAHARAIEFRSKSVDMWFGCVHPRLRELPRSAAVPLPPLLRCILAPLPHVVGLATLEGDQMWLVDLERFAAPSAEREALIQ